MTKATAETQKGLIWMDHEACAKIFRSSPEPVLIVDDNGNIREVNDCACTLFGYTREEMYALEPFAFLAENARSSLPELLMEENVSAGIRKELEFEMKSGETFTAEFLSSIVDFNGTRYRWTVIHDIREPEEAVSPDIESFPELTDFLPELTNEPEMLFGFDLDGTITDINTLGCEKSGYTIKDIRDGLTLFDLFSGEETTRIRADLAYLAGGMKIEGAEYTINARDGRSIPVIISVTPIFVDGEIKGIRAVAIDISDHKKTEQELLIMEKLRVLGELAGGVVHDFNNILAIILGYTEIHPRECSGNRCTQIMEKIKRTALDGVELIKRIRNFTQVNANSDPEIIDLNDIVRDVVDLFHPQWREGEKGKSIDIKTGLTDIPPVYGAPSELREVVSNFFINAIDAIEHSGIISISTTHRNEIVSLSISDTGMGMTEEVRQRVFEPFFTTKGGRGTGLGMSVSYGIINKMGGDITIDSMPGEGTTISVFLPKAEETSAHEATSASIENDVTPLNVLVVDDEDNILEILEEFLITEGHRVTTASCAGDGLDKLSIKEYNVVITDLNMPGMSGWEFAGKIKETSPDTNIIMLTGWGTEVEAKNRETQIVDRFMSKPIDFCELAAYFAEIANTV